MGVILDAIRSIFPRGQLDLKNHGAHIRGGVADSIQDLRDAGRMIIDEGWPGTAVDTLPQWHETMGVAYDPTARSVADQQIMLAAMETSVGGATLAMLQAQFDKEFFGRVIVSEAYVIGVSGQAKCGLGRCGLASETIYHLGYDVTGTIYSIIEAQRVRAIIERYAPAHLEPNSLLTDLSATAIALTGLGRTGIARTGRAS